MRLLMLQIHDPAAVTADFWLLPGGGIKPGESPEQAALREVCEETGLSDVKLGPCVWTDENTVMWADGAPMRIVGRYYAARVAHPPRISFAGHEPPEAATTVGHQWFTLAEITEREHQGAFHPPGLARLLHELLAAPDWEALQPLALLRRCRAATC